MRRILFSLAATIALPLALVAQGKPDFSGSWKLNADKSDPAPQTGGGGGGQRPGGGGMGRATELTITQTATKITIDQKMGDRSRTVSYNLDGSESKNPGMRDNEMVTKSHWDGTTLVTEGDNTVKSPMGEMNIKSKELRTLSADGKEMTVVSTVISPRGENTRKTVYDKQ